MILNKTTWSPYNPKLLFALGLIIAFALSFMEISRGRALNFLVFADSTRDFWNGINPYTSQWVTDHSGRFFLYTPVFSVLFTPFAYLPEWLGAYA